MKKKICFILLCMLFLYGGKVSAVESSCSYSDQAKLNQEFANIKITYEDSSVTLDNKTGELVDPNEVDSNEEGNELEGIYTVHRLKISILNMTENFDIEVTNDKDGSVQRFSYSDVKDGTITFSEDSKLITEIVNYTFTFNTSNQTECAGEQYGIKRLTTPRYNPHHNIELCKENPKVDACQMYVTFEDEGVEAFHNLLESQINKDSSNQKSDDVESSNGFMDFIKNNKEVLLISLGALVVVIAAAVIVNKAKNKRGAL